MDWEMFQKIAMVVEIPALFGALIYIGKKLQILDDIRKSITENIEPELQSVRERFLVVEDRVETIWKDRVAPAFSPRKLNDRGREILAKSGIKEIVDEKKDFLMQRVKEKNPTNAYDAEQTINDVMAALPQHCPDVVDKLKDGAFRMGSNVDEVLFVGSIYLRDQIFEELGYTFLDLGKE